MSFDIPSVRLAQASPSISLEKGSYRIRAPPSRIRASRSPTPRQATAHNDHQRDGHARSGSGMSVTEFVPATYEKRMALLVAILTCAMLLSFGTAYYLWTTSHPTHRVRR